MKVKICGLTCLDDLLLASDLGADYLGFVFYKKSPRCNAPESAAHMLSKYNGAALPVAVFVNETLENILKITESAGIHVVQLHGNESQDMIEGLKKHDKKVFKAVPVKDEKSFLGIEKYACDRILLDTWHPELKGGIGKQFDWGLLNTHEKLVSKAIIAGGINENNIVNLLDGFKPWGIDVSSGVEISPGKKDPNKLEKLFKILKRYKI